jgi:hypothetical protein
MAWYARRERREAWLEEQKRQRRRRFWRGVLWRVAFTLASTFVVWALIKGLEAIG